MKAIIVTAAVAAFAVFAIAAEQEKAPGLTGIEQENARLNQSKKLTPEQRQAIVAAKAAGHQQRMAQMRPPSPQAPAPSLFAGIIAAENVPNPFLAHEFTIVNFWGGQVNGNAVGVYSGFRPDDSARGFLVVFDDKNNTRGTYYEVPGGPAAIASAANGKLLLRSRVAFDLVTRQFK